MKEKTVWRILLLLLLINVGSAAVCYYCYVSIDHMERDLNARLDASEPDASE